MSKKTEEMNEMSVLDKIRNMSTKKLVIGGVVVIVFVSVGCTAYAQNQSQKVEEAKIKLTDQTQDIKSLDDKIVALLDKKDTHYLVKDVKKEQIEELSNQLKKLEAFSSDIDLPKNEYTGFDQAVKTAQDNLKKVETSFATQTAINSLYKQEKEKVAMNGTDVQKELAIADDLKKESLEIVKKDHFKKDSKIAYEKVVNELITNAENQLKQIDKAKEEVAKVYKEDQVITTDTKLYDTAKAEVDKIKNDKIKKELVAKVEKVKVAIDTKAKEEAEKQAQATATQPQTANTNTDTDTASANATASGNQYVADNSNNSAYAGTDGQATGGYTGDNYTGNNGATGNTPTYTPNQPSTPTGGGSTNTPSTNTGGGASTGGTNNANTGGQTNYPNYETGQQEGTLPEGGTWTGGWEEVN